MSSSSSGVPPLSFKNPEKKSGLQTGPAMAPSSSGVRSWRMAFLTLRDETLASPPPPALLALLRDLILSHPSDALVAAATDLPPHEVTSDLVLLAELASAASVCKDVDDVLLWTCHLIHAVSCKVFLGISSSSWTVILNILKRVVEHQLGNTDNSSVCLDNTSRMKALAEVLDILRLAVKAYRRNNSLSEIMELVRLLVCLVSCLHAELFSLHHPHGTHSPFNDSVSRNPLCNSLWDRQTHALSMMCDALTDIGTSIPANLWQSTIEVLRKVMDYLVSKNLLLENSVMSRLLLNLLNCLHLVLLEPEGSLSGHVPGLVATLQLFLVYGLPSRSSLRPMISDLKEKAFISYGIKSGLGESIKSVPGPYKPPHLRKKDGPNSITLDAQCSSDHVPSKYGFTLSDSDHSDSDGSSKHMDCFRSSKVRLAALTCIQDLCHADPKSLTSLWMLLLPENDVLQSRKFEANLMTCLLFDPIMKVRIESTSVLAGMLDGHSLTLSQVAEYKESSKCGSFTTLSSSLGQKLMQLHTGLLYLLQHETHNGLISSLLKVILVLISASPYGRMPGDLLPTAITSLHSKMKEILASKNENIGLLVNTLSCLSASFSRSPPLLLVLKLLEEDILHGFSRNQLEPSIFSTLFHISEKRRHPSIVYEALQVLRAVAHNYPSMVTRFWRQVSDSVHELLHARNHESSCEAVAGFGKEEFSKAVGVTTEKCIMAAIKVLDECLRAVSGFKGADDLQDFRLLDIQRISDCTRSKKISSAPSYELDGPVALNGDCASIGLEQWNEVIVKHLPESLSHASPIVRAASVTCFAGMTSGVFSSLTEDTQEFVISSAVTAAFSDGVPSVRSAACRAIGVLTCFSEIVSRSTVIDKFIRAVDYNSHGPIASVRITASWALANICDALRHRATELDLDISEGEIRLSDSISLLVESALRLTKDGDKIKSNAVRALGNLSRFMRLTNHSAESLPSSGSKSAFHGNAHWLERMVQAFVSCVTTGNVKVQWNVCHALSNLFMNETIKLHDMAPTVYSILLLLLRDSTNFKIRIHAAVALAVPTSRLDYGSSFSDVVQSLEHVRESLVSDQSSTPSSFKYKDNLAKQMTLTMLHVLGFVSPDDDQALKDFLVKKAHVLEEWFKSLTSTLAEGSDQPSATECMSNQNQEDVLTLFVPDKTMLSWALKSLLGVYECGNHQNIAQRFKKLASILL
ncbi:HEAT repeat containing 6 [Musa troglodytarum]|uniref:HEAT repeat containing 6 n=1 Tax=Musa troglodytarum TaxID=320322 RepID=A0A9E7GLH2_9LILI|nr:HEAT repeat containing 6 [Musa troglodytarum]